MDNKKRNVHNSGPLGMLMNSGQIQEVNAEINAKKDLQSSESPNQLNKYILKDAGIEFTANELIYVDVNECEPWEFANRPENEMGDIQELMTSIQKNNQLQPALIRPHPAPHDNIKYEVIFGRRRHQACANLGIPLWVIKKDNLKLMDAIAAQHSENKCRNDVSPYADAITYKELLEKKHVKSQSALAQALNMSRQSLSAILTFNRIPSSLLEKIPNPHVLSVNFALTLVSLIDENPNNLDVLIKNASKIGVTLNSAKSISNLCAKASQPVSSVEPTKLFTSKTGQKLFSVKSDKKGSPVITIDKSILQYFEPDQILQHLQTFLDRKVSFAEES